MKESDKHCSNEGGRPPNRRKRRDENEESQDDDNHDDPLTKMTGYFSSHAVLFLLTQKTKFTLLQDLEMYLRGISPLPTGDAIRFEHAGEQVTEVFGDLASLLQEHPHVFRLDKQSNLESKTYVELLLEPSEICKPLEQQDFYLKWQISLFLVARSDGIALTHQVGTFLASIPPIHTFSTNCIPQHALEQLKKRHKRLLTFTNKFPDTFRWLEGQSSNAKENPSIQHVVAKRNPFQIECLFSDAKHNRTKNMPLQKDATNESNSFYAETIAAFLQSRNNATLIGDIGSNLTTVPSTNASSSHALEQLKTEYGKLSTFLKSNPDLFLVEGGTDVVRLVQQSKQTRTPLPSREPVIKTKLKQKRKESTNAGPAAPCTNSENASNVQRPIVLLRRDPVLHSSPASRKEIGVQKKEDRSLPTKTSSKQRTVPEKQSKKEPGKRIDELQAMLKLMTKERDAERREKNEALKQSQIYREEKIRFELLWKDAQSEKVTLEKRLELMRAGLLQAKGALAKGKETKKRLVQVEREKERMVLLWRDARAELLSTTEKLKLAEARVQHVKLTPEKAKGLENEVRQRTTKLQDDKERMEFLWQDAKAEQDMVKEMLSNSKAEILRIKGLLTDEHMLRHEASMRLSRVQTLLNKSSKGTGTCTQGLYLQRELELTREMLERGISNASNKPLKEETKPRVKVNGLEIRPRILTRNEVPRERPGQKPQGLQSQVSNAVSEETLRFDGAKNTWKGTGIEDGTDSEELSRVEAELSFVDASYGNEEVRVDASAVTRFLRLDVVEKCESVVVDLVLTIPAGYPDDAALDIDARISDSLTCGNEVRKCAFNALPSMLECCRWEAQGCRGSEALLSVLSIADGWVASEWAGIQSKQFPPVAKKDGDCHQDLEMCHMLVHSHHITESEVVQFVSTTASKIGLGSYIRLGKPGFVLVEGLEVNCESFLECLVLQRKKLREASRGAAYSSTFSEIGRTIEFVKIHSEQVLPKRSRVLEGQDGLGVFRQLCEDANLKKPFEDACGY